MQCATQQDRPEREGWGERNRDTPRCWIHTPAHFRPLTVPVWHKLDGAQAPTNRLTTCRVHHQAVSGSKQPPKLAGWTVSFPVEI